MAALQATDSKTSGLQIDAASLEEAQADAFKLMQLIRTYMSHGHLQADLDPLNMKEAYPNATNSPYAVMTEEELTLLDFKRYGFTEKDMDRTFYVDLP